MRDRKQIQEWSVTDDSFPECAPQQRKYYLWGIWDEATKSFTEGRLRAGREYPTPKTPTEKDRAFIKAVEYVRQLPQDRTKWGLADWNRQLNEPRVAGTRLCGVGCGQDQEDKGGQL